MSDPSFHNVAPQTRLNSFFHHVYIRFHAHENDFAPWHKFANSSGGFDSVWCWKSNIKEN